jgi:hypothetical protein
MIGMVWVSPLFRRKGIGTTLLASTTEFLREQGVDFGLLWTGVPAVYTHAGWFISDRGLFGVAESDHYSGEVEATWCRPLTSLETSRLEDLRSRLLMMRVLRTKVDYRTVPIPAETVSCFLPPGSDGRQGFALVGNQGDTGFLYEAVAPLDLWRPLWSAILARYRRVFVNGHVGEPFTTWLRESERVVLRPQTKAMWLRVSGRIGEKIVQTWQVPYFDWI